MSSLRLPYGQAVGALIERGIEAAPYAFHGTNADAIIHLAEHGSLPTTNSYGNYFYYTPLNLESEQYQRGAACYFAGRSAMRVAFKKELGFEPSSQVNIMRAIMHRNLGESSEPNAWTELAQEARDHDVEPTELEHLFERYESMRHRGVLLGISKSVADDFEETAEFGDYNEASITVPEGLPITYISGIELLGQTERQILEKLVIGE
jgi:hypothetical protein